MERKRTTERVLSSQNFAGVICVRSADWVVSPIVPAPIVGNARIDFRRATRAILSNVPRTRRAIYNLSARHLVSVRIVNGHIRQSVYRDGQG